MVKDIWKKDCCFTNPHCDAQFNRLVNENARLKKELEERPILDCMCSKDLLKKENARLRQALIDGADEIMKWGLDSHHFRVIAEKLRDATEVKP